MKNEKSQWRLTNFRCETIYLLKYISVQIVTKAQYVFWYKKLVNLANKTYPYDQRNKINTGLLTSQEMVDYCVKYIRCQKKFNTRVTCKVLLLILYN